MSRKTFEISRKGFYPLYRILKKNRSTIKANSYNFSDGFQKAYEKDRSSIKYLVDAAYSLEDSIRIEFFQLLEIQIVIKDLIKQENENDLFLLIELAKEATDEKTLNRVFNFFLENHQNSSLETNKIYFQKFKQN